MKKTLVVMRHGKAMPPAQGQQDIERSLTRAGEMALAARLPHMLRLVEKGSAAQIWTSPALRACQTAKLLEKALHERHVLLKKTETLDCLWEQDIDELLARLRESDANVVFAVGHVPFAEDVVEELTGSTPSFSTGALGCVEVNLSEASDGEGQDGVPAQDDARLLWFVQGPVATDWKTLLQLQQILTERAEAIEERRQSFFATPDDIETIHRFRTFTRGLRSLVAFIKPWQNKEQNVELQTILRDVVRHTSRLRELDVFEKQVCADPNTSPELRELCKQEASDERARVLKVLASKQVARAFERAMAMAKHIAWRKRYVKRGLPEPVVRARFDALIESVTAELAGLRLSDAEQTHDVRKRAKRARYVSEFCSGILGEDAVAIAKGMMAHQDDLGDVCDARANIRLIGEFLQRELPESVVWELNLMRAQNETFLYSTLKAHEAGE